MLKHEDYTVGWICGITTEYVAAQSFLDERHDGPEDVSTNDSNDYTLGTMGKHNVVIAVLPDGEYGIASAAAAARDMLHTFPNVRISLLVGIGGGAPSKKHDIRLGDVVVSIPSSKATGSVLHYGFSKTMQNQNFETIGYLNLPPTVLRSAANGLKASYESDGHQIQEAIDSILHKKSKLRKKYSRPDPSSDRLYQSDVVHPLSDDDDISCASVCGSNPANWVRRSKRSEEDDDPAIHYGLIASASQLVRDATIRDTLAREKDILCFETEAAGLMNRFPCLVIRGICDYSDTHADTAWQGYAAMTAAAYTKDLLSRIPVSKVQAERKIGEILSGMYRRDYLYLSCSFINSQVIGVEEGVNKLLHIQHDRYEEEILNWLSPINYASTQIDHIARRQPGTGQWFLGSAEYQTWLKGDRLTLFCPGIPGAGKTMITAIVIDDIYNRFHNDTTVGIAYLYCDYRRQYEQTIEELLLSLVKQLAQRQATVLNEVPELCSKYPTEPKSLSLDHILILLHSVSKLFSRVFVIVDALDECRADGCRTKLLDAIFNLQVTERTNIFLTARFIPDILNIFKESATLEIRAQDEDVQQFITNQITKLPSFVLSDADLQNEIKTIIAKAVDGMFLLAALHMDALCQEPTVGHIELALKSLPRGLDEMYTRAMIRVKSQGVGAQDLAMKILAWVIHARRALSLAELQHAVAVEPGKPELNCKFIPSSDVIRTICAGLITIDNESNAVRLVHHTTQEYFEKAREMWSLNDQSIIATACIAYLSLSTFESGCCPTDAAYASRLQENPLYMYAARHWGHHICESWAGYDGAMEFLQCNAKMEAASQALMVDWPFTMPSYTNSQSFPTDMTGLHLAAYFGLEGAVKALLASHDPDAHNSYERTPLSYAAESGHTAVAQLLLDTRRVDVNSMDCLGEAPLHRATYDGHEAVVKLLLRQTGIIADHEGKYEGRTPLSFAAGEGHEAVVELLLAKGEGLDVNSQDSRGQTAIMLAAKNGHEAVVRLLRAAEGINVNSEDCDGHTACMLAAEKGHTAVVRVLLEVDGIKANTEDWVEGDESDEDYVVLRARSLQRISHM
ncbi:hypothetical protein BBK36DRAFT_1169900 [Trichoderma citrinoviride]|uniref:Uncharacterized protein n=1 Tax=Trichoderma citrinoviride TaxID=58853 RepID=A0A2T4B715_9HYPO|nr:hypothetical protein BBK36DRAFT_1169900 [Trichoderma citrinoviride]PTB65133.1 hypothetical protein BBK36DRAFT_1169900 [Trichoderma citrinoviride]